MRRHALILSAALLSGCREPATIPTEAHKGTETHTELDLLARLIALPPGSRAAHWIVRAQGVADPNIPGPTDTILSAYVEIDPAKWGEVERALAPSGTGELRLADDVASAILPGGGKYLPQRAGSRLVTGPRYAAAQIARSPYFGEWAIRWRDGLVFELFTR